MDVGDYADVFFSCGIDRAFGFEFRYSLILRGLLSVQRGA
jgi:hypothetical protein